MQEHENMRNEKLPHVRIEKKKWNKLQDEKSPEKNLPTDINTEPTVSVLSESAWQQIQEPVEANDHRSFLTFTLFW